MGARPSSFKKGGGRLNGVDGVMTGYQFSTEYPFKGEGAPAKKSDFNSLYFILSIRQDGADEDTLEPIWAGNADNFEISEDGLTLTPVEEGFEIGATTDFGRFVSSLVDSGFPETNLPEDEINYEAIIGTRVRFVQVDQVGKDGKVKTRVVKKGKYKGKTFNQTATQISNVLALPGKQGQTKTAAAPATPGKKVTKGNGKAEPSAEVNELATQTLLDILSETDDGSIAKAKLRMRIIKKLGSNNPMRDDVVKALFDDAFLASVDGVEYDAADKAQTISLA